jgi:hypothetical protein
MRQVIAKREENLEKINTIKSDFYSRGLIKIKMHQKKFQAMRLAIWVMG